MLLLARGTLDVRPVVSAVFALFVGLALARVPFDLPLVYFTARAVSVRLISFRFCADRFCVCSLLLLVRGTLDVRPVVSAVFALFVAFALARVPFDLPLVRVRCSLHQLSVLRGSVSS
jgi:hypothetical protein